MAGSTYGDINQRTAGYAVAEMLEHARPVIVLSDYGQSKPLPKNKAEQVKFRRPIPNVISTKQLTEGVTPTSYKTKFDDVAVTMGQYGGVAEITDRVHDLSEDPVLKEAAILAGEEAAEVIEMVTWGVIKGGTNVIYAAAADTVRTDVKTPISLTAQRSATRTLQAQRGKPITKRMDSSVKYGQESIEACYIAFGHTDIDADIREIPGFIPSSKYGTETPLPYEIGKVETVRYILTPLLEPFPDAGAPAAGTGMVTSGTNVDVYPIVIIAKDAYGCIPLRGVGAIKPTVINPDTISKSDILGQRGYVGWKAYYAALVLNQAWMVRIEVGVSELNGVF